MDADVVGDAGYSVLLGVGSGESDGSGEMKRITEPLIRDGFKETIEMATWRVENLLSKSAFAVAIGVTYKTIVDIEAGRRRPQNKTYEKFCELRDRYKLRRRVEKELTPRQRVHLDVWGTLPRSGPMTGHKNPNAGLAQPAVRKAITEARRLNARKRNRVTEPAYR
jgi:DNA-binding XRE family transcriptional regulator